MLVGMIGPSLDAQGGIASVARTWMETQALHAVQVDYIGTMTDGPLPSKLVRMGWRHTRYLGKLARGWRPDLFHIHMSSYVSFYRKLAYFEEARATGAPVLVHLHGSDMEDFFAAGGIHEAAIHHMFSRAARVVCLSQSMARAVSEWMPSAPVAVIYNPVDLGRFRHPPRPPRPNPVVLFMGLVGERKGTWDLLEAIPQVIAAVPEARFRFGGNGEVEKLQAEVKRQGLEGIVSVLGWVSGDERERQYEEADVYCLPSYHEGLPMSILEAMADSLPVVSTPVAGIPEAVIHERNGLIVPTGDPPTLAAALIRLLQDPELRAAQGRAGRVLAEERFDAEVICRQVVALWEQVLSERRAHASA